MKTKHRAQARIYGPTKHLAPEQLIAYYQRLGETARQRRAELCASAQTAVYVRRLPRDARRGTVEQAAQKPATEMIPFT